MKEICVEEESFIFIAEAKTFRRTTVQPAVTKFQTHADNVAISRTGEDLRKNLSEKMTNAYITEIEEATKGQHANESWHKARHHVITASKAHSVKTRVETAMKSAEKIDFTNTLACVRGNQKLNDNVPALRYGREMEAEAVSVFAENFKKTHKML